MVDIPRPPTNTVAVSEGTPQLTINHDAVVDLDSSNAFEGPEKLLEVWFAPSADTLPPGAHRDGLKAVSPEVWKEMLDVVNCKVLSIVESDHVDAYLLSESSMFVFSHKLILKTCGTTTLLWGLPHILDIAAAKAGFAHHRGSNVKGTETAATPYRVFYSRKNFLFPDRQRGPHRSWNDEVTYLDKMFWGGSAYMVGKMNGDHWYLYLTSPNTDITPPRTPESEKATETKVLSFPGEETPRPNNATGNDDETLEVLMTDLDVEKAKQFYLENASALAESNFHKQQKLANQESTPDALPIPSELTTEGHALGTVVSESCGLSALYPPSRYPDARVDAYLFTPCGFSANGVIPAPDAPGVGAATHYFTVHVTPEPQCSYASFETNVPGQQTGGETAEVIEHVVGIFAPGRFSVTLFEGKECEGDLKALDERVEGVAVVGGGNGVVNGEVKGKRRGRMDAIRGYRRVERIVHEFDGYDLVFHYYERDDWKGGAPVVGEVM
ncbi:spermidine resistance protein [Pseudogymnoascus verrucosus]|uniref:adenosylmethionine decarboxylase n=1 Tax=Pseudogymnoascus verrucosus TaxID=342668 RepID=A0A1B8GB56_9PEZI|nr:spermidine resistance protein [Pseudogymnoascus verrucosus]OBT93079.1 spermidine resistance protein [Pseudogymnoascus verrucosus]